MHLILTAAEPIRRRLGGAGAWSEVHAALLDLIAARSEAGLSTELWVVDDPTSSQALGLEALNPDAPDFAAALVDALGRLEGERGELESLLIVGGHRIVPFHQLENPMRALGDPDPVVHSDNPYASRDPDVLIPERAVGRLPDGGRRSFLTGVIRGAAAAHRAGGSAKGILTAGTQVRGGCRPAPPAPPPPPAGPTVGPGRVTEGGPEAPTPEETAPSPLPPAVAVTPFGMTTQSWIAASRHVYREGFGAQGDLKISPPVIASGVQGGWLSGATHAYFNLHGLRESPNWYGEGEGAYPVALTPGTLASLNLTGLVVLTEACYGAHILDRTPATSLALRFLERGAWGVIGSTETSYGPAEPPPGEADLIVLFAAQALRAGRTLGEALVEAKVKLASEALRRLGRLEADDQKTLLEFVLYGDPTLRGRGR